MLPLAHETLAGYDNLGLEPVWAPFPRHGKVSQCRGARDKVRAEPFPLGSSLDSRPSSLAPLNRVATAILSAGDLDVTAFSRQRAVF